MAASSSKIHRRSSSRRFSGRIHKVEAWLDGSSENALAALQSALQQEADSPRQLYQTLSVIRLKLQRDAGIPFGPESQVRFQKLFTDVEQGLASDQDRLLASRFSVSFQLSSALLQLDPTLNQPLSPADQARIELQEATSKIFIRLQAIAPEVSPGGVTPESIRELAAILAEYLELASQAALDNAALPDVYYGAASTALSLAKSCVIAGRNTDAAARFEEAAGYFERAGHADRAAECRTLATDLQQRLAADFDTAAAQHLESLIAPAQDHLGKAKALIDLTDVASNSGDIFEALQNAEAAALELTRAGYLDPAAPPADPPVIDPAAVDIAVDSWISTACATLSGIPLLRRVTETGICIFQCSMRVSPPR